MYPGGIVGVCGLGSTLSLLSLGFGLMGGVGWVGCGGSIS
jgi:hypothetical protein